MFSRNSSALNTSVAGAIPRFKTGRWAFAFVCLALCLALNADVPSVQAREARIDKGKQAEHPYGPFISPPVVVTAPTELHQVNTTFTSPISVDDITGDNIISFQFNVEYDPTVINPFGPNFGCSNVGTIVTGFAITCNVITPGTLLLTANTSGTFIPTGSGPIVNITWKAVPSAPAGSVSPLNFQAGSIFFFNNLGMFPNTPVNGSITLTGTLAAATTVSGRVLNQAGRPIAKAMVVLQGDSGAAKTALTNPFGYFYFQDVQAGQTYVVKTTAKKYTFAPRILSVDDQIVDLAIVSDQ